MKLKVIKGEKGKKKKGQTQMPIAEKPRMAEKSDMPGLEDYYSKERPRPQDMEQAEGDEDIVEKALKNQNKKTGAAA